MLGAVEEEVEAHRRRAVGARVGVAAEVLLPVVLGRRLLQAPLLGRLLLRARLLLARPVLVDGQPILPVAHHLLALVPVLALALRDARGVGQLARAAHLLRGGLLAVRLHVHQLVLVDAEHGLLVRLHHQVEGIHRHQHRPPPPERDARPAARLVLVHVDLHRLQRVLKDDVCVGGQGGGYGKMTGTRRRPDASQPTNTQSLGAAPPLSGQAGHAPSGSKRVRRGWDSLTRMRKVPSS